LAFFAAGKPWFPLAICRSLIPAAEPDAKRGGGEGYRINHEEEIAESSRGQQNRSADAN
jgi:hypothetical protein